MSLAALLKEKRTERKNTLDAAGAILEKAAKEKRSITPEEDQEFERRHLAGDTLEKEIKRLEKQIEASSQLENPAGDSRRAGEEDITRETENKLTDAQRKAIEVRCVTKWMRGGMQHLTDEERSLIERRNASMPEEIRALSASVGASGAYTVPIASPYGLEIATKAYGGLLAVAGYIPTESGVDLPYPTMNDTSNNGETISENQGAAGSGASGAAAAQDPAFGMVTLRAYMSDSGIVLLPIQLLQDSAFNAEGWMNDTLTVRLGRRKNYLCTVGTGVNQPTGLLTAAPVGVTTAVNTGFTYNELLDLEHSVDPSYRNPGQATWMWSDSTLKVLKKLTDGNGRPLWIAGGVSEGVQNRRPDTFDGYQYTINQDFPAVAASAKVIAFGDFSKYKIREVKQIQMIRFNERFMEKLQVGFMAYQRFDGNLIDAGTHPIEVLQMHS